MQDHYQTLYDQYRWWVPHRFNIAEMCCNRWNVVNTDQRRVAVFFEEETGQSTVWTYAQIGEYANKLSNGLQRMGIQRGDRVAIVLGQRPETIIAHMAIYQLGAIAVPIPTGIHPEGLEFRLKDSESRIAIIDRHSGITSTSIYSRCPMLRQIISVESENEFSMPWRTLLARQDVQFTPVDTSSYDPAIIMYSSGSTGNPKGAVLTHGALIGQLPGFVCANNWFPETKDILWCSTDWAHMEGLLSALLPTLYFGCPVVATRGSIEPQRALALLVRYRVTHMVSTPGFLRKLYQAYQDSISKQNLVLRSIVSTGSPLPTTIFEWSQRILGITPNEVFGVAEANYIIGHSQDLWPAVAGSMGRPYPGHQVALLDAEGQAVPLGMMGEICIHRRDTQMHQDPAVFMGYWRQEDNRSNFRADWYHTGEYAYQDAEGNFWYIGRPDELLHDQGTHQTPVHILEHKLQELSGVLYIAVISERLPDGIQEYTVYLVTTPNIRPPHVERLHKQIHQEFAKWLEDTPHQVVIESVPDIVRTASGKVRRFILRTKDRSLMMLPKSKTQYRAF